MTPVHILRDSGDHGRRVDGPITKCILLHSPVRLLIHRLHRSPTLSSLSCSPLRIIYYYTHGLHFLLTHALLFGRLQRRCLHRVVPQHQQYTFTTDSRSDPVLRCISVLRRHECTPKVYACTSDRSRLGTLSSPLSISGFFFVVP